MHLDSFVRVVKHMLQKHDVVSVNFVMREDSTNSPTTIKEYRNASKEEVIGCLDTMAEFRKMLVGE